MPINLTELVPFGVWAPDLPEVAGGAIEARNVLPIADYYGPLSGTNEVGGMIGSLSSARIYAAAAFVDSSGNAYVFAAGSASLFRYSNGSWADVTRTGSSYNTAADARWAFAQYGNRIITTNGTDVMQTFLMGSSARFQNITGQAPIAKCLTVVNNFVFTGNTGSAPNQVRWCALDNPLLWTQSVATQADYQQIENEGGEVVAVVGTQNFVTVFQERAIVRGEYIGPEPIFTFSDAERGRGALCQGGVIAVGPTVYYIGGDGVYAFDGTQSRPIGLNRVNKWFFRTLDDQYIYRITAASDPINNIVLWSFPSRSAINGRPDTVLIYDYFEDKFTYAQIQAQFVFQALTTGYTLEGLNAVSTNLDLLPFSLDSSVWKGGKTILGLVGQNNKLAFFTGDPLEALVESKEYQFSANGRVFVDAVSVNTDADVTDVFISLGYRNAPSQDVTYSAEINPLARSNVANFRQDARYQRVRVRISGDFGKIVGAQISYIQTGQL